MLKYFVVFMQLVQHHFEVHRSVNMDPPLDAIHTFGQWERVDYFPFWAGQRVKKDHFEIELFPTD
jgi:hypothetical protein